MNKNGTIRVAVLLLALTLITSCFVGSTFAKYVTKTNINDNVRVAYWGFKENSTLVFDLFEASYFDDGFNGGETASVNSQDGVNIIAPGTSWETTFEFRYTPYDNPDDPITKTKITAPEVAYTLDIQVEFFNASGDDEAYNYALDECPQFYWLLDGEKYSTFRQLEDALESLDGVEDEESCTYAPNELPTYFQQGQTHTIGWVWEFEDDEPAGPDNDEDEDGITDQDEIDTKMGNNNDDGLENFMISITFIATQVEEGRTEDF